MKCKCFFWIFFLVLFIIQGNLNMYPETITVSTTNDNVPGSLRAAIHTANTNGEDNVIYLTAGTYKITGDDEDENNQSGDLDIFTGKKLLIIGINRNNTFIDGNGVDRVLDIFSGRITLRNITIRNGKSPTFGNDYYVGRSQGGGIYNAGDLILIDCNIISNSSGTHGGSPHHGGSGGNGGGIYNTGVLAIENCIFEYNKTGNGNGGGMSGGAGGYGGGIYNSDKGYITINDTTIHNNQAGDGASSEDSSTGGCGGAICSYGVLYLINCTVSANKSGDGGQGFEYGNGGDGGGLFIGDGEGSLINCTISGNSTGKGADSLYSDGAGGYGGGIAKISGMLQLISCTVCNNATGEGESNLYPTGVGGGIFNKNGVEAYLENTIIANNLIHTNSKGKDIYGTFESNGYNLIEDTSDGTLIGKLKGNITGVDPLLSPLADNGGHTKTHALLTGSPAIDKGYSSYYYDQRGYTRPIDIPGINNSHKGEDIGAFEYDSNNDLYYTIEPKTLLFCADTAGNQSGSQQVSLSIAEGYSWSLSENLNWLSCSPTSGKGSGNITVSINPLEMQPGTYIEKIAIYFEDFKNFSYVRIILQIYESASTSQPFGSFDTPIANSTVFSSVPFTGWALDDIGVKNVKIYREQKNELIFIGDAVFVEGARPDIMNQFPAYLGNSRAGWGYMMLTNFLPNGGNGSFTFQAIAEDIEGNQVTLARKTVMIDNAHAVQPFGALDTPEQGGTAAGAEYINFGWALTPPPGMIPTDGSTIWVWVDGKLSGNPVYNKYREDIASLFPGYANSNGAGGHFVLDTTQYDNGVHTIAWSVKDFAGNIDGIGSRYFTTSNSDNRQETSGNSQDNSPWNPGVPVPALGPENTAVNFNPIAIKEGYDTDSKPHPIYPDDSGNFIIDITELERLEIDLAGMERMGQNPAIQGQEQWQGNHLIGDRLCRLPIGSTLEPLSGVFYWTPGPGFTGSYRLVFTATKPNGESRQVFITVNLHPKFGKK